MKRITILAPFMLTLLSSLSTHAQQAPPEKLVCPIGETSVKGHCVRLSAQAGPENPGGSDEKTPKKPIIECPENWVYRNGKCLPVPAQ